MISDAAIVAHKTGLELRKVYGWMYKHDVTRERIVRYAKACRWYKISDCIEKDQPLEWLVAGAAVELAEPEEIESS